MFERINITKGMLYHIIKTKRPDLAKKIKETGKLETIVVGLGKQGTKHAGIMHNFGTTVAAGIDNKKSGRVHEVIPIYKNVKQCLDEHPDIAAASIWKHYSSAKDSTIEIIESGIPLVVLISEFMPEKDVKDVRLKAKEHNTLLLGPNTPGIIFPPEGIKIGMLPDVFYPAVRNQKAHPEGVTIISRSGAILYHLSDALASAGIAQNAVLGIGGDSIIGSDFKDLVPLAMSYKNTDLIVVAGEIGGCKEEMLAQHIQKNPKLYKKPLVALISGANAPAGKTMGHAGALITPGQNYGTFESKKTALENAGVKVVNSQKGLVKTIQELLKNKKYFPVQQYYKSMEEKWNVLPEKPSWGTYITKVEPNKLTIRDYTLQDLIENVSILEAAHLLVEGSLPNKKELEKETKIAVQAIPLPTPKLDRTKGEDLSKLLGKYLLNDEHLAKFQGSNSEKTMFCLGRMVRYLGNTWNNERFAYYQLDKPFSHLIYKFFTGNKKVNENHARMLEAMIVASIDHGVTPPSAQATIIAASTRTSYEVAVEHGIGAITDVHGGAGAKAAEFFKTCTVDGQEYYSSKIAENLILAYLNQGKRIQGLGHRIHTQDPRRDVLYKIAQESGVAGGCVDLSKNLSNIFERVKGLYLPLNVDGAIGAIVADMNLNPEIAKALFIYGRTAGLSAHYFEEITTQSPMRRINFNEAIYKGDKCGKK